MSATASVSAIVMSPATTPARHVVATVAGIDPHTARIAALIDPEFLTEAGWDPAGLMLAPPSGHRLLGRPVCRVEGCLITAAARARICGSCRRRLAEHGLSADEIALLPAREQPMRGLGSCVVGGCARQWVSSRALLCRAHLQLQRRLGLTVAQLRVHHLARPLPACGPCAVAACPRQRRHRDGLYCEAHQQRLRDARHCDPGLDERHWRAIEPAIGQGGQVSLRGLPALVVAQVLFGLQQRCRLDAVKTRQADLRALCNELR